MIIRRCWPVSMWEDLKAWSVNDDGENHSPGWKIMGPLHSPLQTCVLLDTLWLSGGVTAFPGYGCGYGYGCGCDLHYGCGCGGSTFSWSLRFDVAGGLGLRRPEEERPAELADLLGSFGMTYPDFVAEGPDEVREAPVVLVEGVEGVPGDLLEGVLVDLVEGVLVDLVEGVLVDLVEGVLVDLVEGVLVDLVEGVLVDLVGGVPVDWAIGIFRMRGLSSFSRLSVVDCKSIRSSRSFLTSSIILFWTRACSTKGLIAVVSASVMICPAASPMRA